MEKFLLSAIEEISIPGNMIYITLLQLHAAGIIMLEKYSGIQLCVIITVWTNGHIYVLALSRYTCRRDAHEHPTQHCAVSVS